MTLPEESNFFLGTYFDRDAVLRLERRTRLLGWAIFGIYLIQYLYDMGIFLYNSLANQLSIDWMYPFFNLGRPFQGLMILVVLYVLAQALLILLDIEHNTRQAARAQQRQEKTDTKYTKAESR